VNDGRANHVRATLAVAFLLSLGCGSGPRTPTPVKTAVTKRATPAFEDVVVPHGAYFDGTLHEHLVIRFIGNARASGDELARAMRSTEGLLVDDVLQYDEWALVGWYLDHGFVQVHVARPTVEVLPASGGVRVTVVVDEGRPFTIRSIDVYEDEQGTCVPSSAWRNPIRPGVVYNRAALITALQAVQREYRDLGYAKVEAIPELTVDATRDEIAIVVPVRRGALFRFGRITFRGVKTLSESLLLERLSVKASELYSETELEKSKQRLLDTGWFDRVDLAITEGMTADRVDLSVEVDEAHVPTMTASK
jgi:outer membrane protein insertion porin family